MISAADDYPIHQTPDPIAFAGSDRNFYDRYFFNGFEPDGSLFFGVAIGVYPQLNIIDFNFSVLVDGTQYCVHGSRVLLGDRLDISVGPMRLTVIEPLKELRIIIDGAHGIAADISFVGRSVPMQEPRFTRRLSTRLFQDFTRMVQNGRWSGWINIDGRRIELSPKAVGTRDRSWGIRPVGAPDSQLIVPPVQSGFFWQWTPLNFSNFSVFFHVAADADGKPWNTHAVLAADAGGGELLHHDKPKMAMELVPGTRWPMSGSLALEFENGTIQLEFKPFLKFFMKGIGYFHPEWYHGKYHSPLTVAREDFDVGDLNPNSFEHFFVEHLSAVSLTRDDGSSEDTVGIFEQLILGSYAPIGLTSDEDVSKWNAD